MGILSSLRKGVGNALVSFIYGNCFKPSTTDDQDSSDTSSPDHHAPDPVSQPSNPVSALALDLFHFDNTCEVPELLGEHVTSSKKAQAKWYKKLLKAWKGAKPPPKTPEQASRLVMQTLNQHQKADVEGLLKFYGLPVDAKSVPDGDMLTVYVDAADPREALSVPKDVQDAVLERSKARASKDYPKADALHKTFVDAGSDNEEVLARKYRILFRGIDAPENKQPYGKEAKKELTKMVQGKCVIVHVYGEDQYGRHIGDVYCNGDFVQEILLKKGLAWHYAAYDKRPELIQWAKEASAAGVGLWAASDPEKPWEWRKNNSRDEKQDKLN
ncbi:hypothetical protein MKW94_021876 [Papaver nudicaule]|uniref:TNase-like domain-containing protein n=1 Tax=Papaver nudicaule TaxID=74823 RepID=A0AA41VFJ6_PAPNU|nr:hypothetical protein [Papaver nudicaule]